MSKSLNNTILLSDDPETVKLRLRKAVTDPQKLRKNDPGRPEVCAIFTYQSRFNEESIKEIEDGCRSGALGCVDCKLRCADKLNLFLAPIIERRKHYEERIDEVKDVLAFGEKTARNIAEATMTEVRNKMKIG